MSATHLLARGGLGGRPGEIRPINEAELKAAVHAQATAPMPGSLEQMHRLVSSAFDIVAQFESRMRASMDYVLGQEGEGAAKISAPIEPVGGKAGDILATFGGLANRLNALDHEICRLERVVG